MAPERQDGQQDSGQRRRDRRGPTKFKLESVIPIRERLEEGKVQWVTVKLPRGQCPYVYRGDQIGIISTRRYELPIPYMIRPPGSQGVTFVGQIDLQAIHVTRSMINFTKEHIEFAVFDVDIKQAPVPESKDVSIVPCVDNPHSGQGSESPPGDTGPDMRPDRGRKLTDSTTDVTSSTTRTTTPSIAEDIQEIISNEISKDMTMGVGVISAVAIISVVTSIVVCVRSRKADKLPKDHWQMRNSLIPVYNGTFSRHIERQKVPNLSNRNPVYGENTDFLRAVSFSGDSNNQIPYILIPSSMLASCADGDGYEEVRNILSRQTSLAMDDNKKSGNDPQPAKPHTYLDLQADDESGITDMQQSGSESGSVSGSTHAAVCREASGAYCKIDD